MASMVLMSLECIMRCSSSTSGPRDGTGIGSGRRVNDEYVSHNEACRQDGEDVTAVFAVGGSSIPEVIHCGLASSAHTSAMCNSAQGLKKHICVVTYMSPTSHYFITGRLFTTARNISLILPPMVHTGCYEHIKHNILCNFFLFEQGKVAVLTRFYR
jgi:hypothetical protein